MKAFAALYHELDASTSTLAKQAALQAYMRDVPPEDAAWAVYFLAGGKPRQLVPAKLLRQLAQEAAGLPLWLFDECYEAVGDLAETISLLLPQPTDAHERGLAAWMREQLLPLRGAPADEVMKRLRGQWQQLPQEERLVYFKLITGAFRVGVSKLQVTQALAAVAGLDSKRVAQRLMGYTHIGARPDAKDFLALIAEEDDAESAQRSGQPYPFFLAHPLQADVAQLDAVLGSRSDWIAEWKWDGIRAQIVKRAGSAWLWSRGEELFSERFPELQAMGEALPDGTVLDGEVVVWQRDAQTPPGEGSVQPFSALQKRIGRKMLGPKLLRELPVALVAYDLLEQQGEDLRALPQQVRRERLDALVRTLQHPSLVISPVLRAASWQELAGQRSLARSRSVEGLMLKRRDARYGVGRTKDVGVWWKWKIDPFSVDAVLIYAQRGHGRRAGVYSDYTFAVWDGPPGQQERHLVPFAKAYSGLSDAEMAQVDAVIRKTTIESFGPVRSVRPTLVFELGFEGIARSPRHKSGIAVRFPRILRLRQDKPVQEADTLQSLAELLPPGA